MRSALLILVLLTSWLTAHGNSVLPTVGSEIRYSCKGESYSDRYVLNWHHQGGMVIYEESFSSPKKKESPRWDGVAQGWEYIAGAHYLRANPSILTKNKLKSGNLEKVTTLKPGTYSGVIESTNRNGKFDVSVSTKVGKEQRIDTKIGRATLVVELESVMGNADGNGAVVRRSAFYSKSFRLIINEKVEVSKPSAWIFPYDCEVQGVKRRSRVPKSKLAEFSWPKAGTELSYKCEGSIKSLKMNVIKNQKDNVIVEIIRDSQKPFRAAGPGWKLYFGLADHLVDAEGKPMRAYSMKGGGSKPPAKVGLYEAGYSSSTRPEEVVDLYGFLSPPEVRVVTNHGEKQISYIRAYHSGQKAFFRFTHEYSSELKLPVAVEAADKMGNKFDYRCELDSGGKK